MHHADAEAVGIIGVFDLDLFAVFFDNALLCLIQAEQNAHKRALARAVFAEQSMYLAFFELKGNIIIGDYARKALCYMQHFYRICLFQNPNLPFRILSSSCYIVLIINYTIVRGALQIKLSEL